MYCIRMQKYDENTLKKCETPDCHVSRVKFITSKLYYLRCTCC